MSEEKKDDVSKTIIGWAVEENIELTDEVVELAKKAEAEKQEAREEAEKKEKNSLSYALRQAIKDNMPKIVTVVIVIIGAAIAKYYDLPIKDLF